MELLRITLVAARDQIEMLLHFMTIKDRQELKRIFQRQTIAIVVLQLIYSPPTMLRYFHWFKRFRTLVVAFVLTVILKSQQLHVYVNILCNYLGLESFKRSRVWYGRGKRRSDLYPRDAVWGLQDLWYRERGEQVRVDWCGDEKHFEAVIICWGSWFLRHGLEEYSNLKLIDMGGL